MAALSLGDKQALLARRDVAQAQAEHLAAAQTTQQHRLSHGSIAMGTQSGEEAVNINWRQDAWQGARRANEWCGPATRLTGRSSRCHATRHWILVDGKSATDHQISEEPGD